MFTNLLVVPGMILIKLKAKKIPHRQNSSKIVYSENRKNRYIYNRYAITNIRS